MTLTLFLAWEVSSKVLAEQRVTLGDSFPNQLPKSYERPYKTITATITAYNTVEWQTDSSPCISSSGVDICGKTGVAACPRNIPLHTIISIAGIHYQCLDRLSPKYDNRFDISFDKDVKGAKEFGKQIKEVKIYDN